jgi:hypothetical protein
LDSNIYSRTQNASLRATPLILLIPLHFNFNGHETHSFVPTTVFYFLDEVYCIRQSKDVPSDQAPRISNQALEGNLAAPRFGRFTSFEKVSVQLVMRLGE